MGAIFVLIKGMATRKLEYVFPLVMILATWLPYAFIGRIMFMYHYFITLPFIMLALVALIKELNEGTKNNWVLISYIILIIVGFGIFYPVTSGMEVSTSYIEWTKWFKTWSY